MNDKQIIEFKNYIRTEINPETCLADSIEELNNKGIKNIGKTDDPDDCEISKIIYRKIFNFYNEENCRGDTLNTFNSTFGRDEYNNLRLRKIFKRENKVIEDENELIIKIENFKKIYLSIGNFTVLERWHKKGETRCINCIRGTGKLHDSWPLTLLCIQDYFLRFSGTYLNKFENPFEEALIRNESTKKFFEKYINFEEFCNTHYFNPDKYGNNKKLTYVHKDEYGKYIVDCDLFKGLSFNKPLPETIEEMEEYIDNVTPKIIARGKVMLDEYFSTT